MKLLDTDVLIEILKENRVEELKDSCLSVITLIEFLRGIKNEKERRIVKENLEKMVKIVGIENKAILVYSKIYRELKKEGKLLSDADLLQASLAIANDLRLVTKNIKHFKRLEKFGLRL